MQHGTPEGHENGCKGRDDCPAVDVHGMSCTSAYLQATTTPARYYKAKAIDPRPAAIARRLGYEPGWRHPDTTTNQTDPPAPVPAAPTTPTAPVAPAARVLTRTQQIRTWAREHGLHTPARGPMPDPLQAAFDADDPALAIPPLREDHTMPPTPTPKAIRDWATARGFDCPTRGKIPNHIRQAYEADLNAVTRDTPEHPDPENLQALADANFIDEEQLHPDRPPAEFSELLNQVRDRIDMVDTDTDPVDDTTAEPTWTLPITIPADAIADRPDWATVAISEDVEQARDLTARLWEELHRTEVALEVALRKWASATDTLTTNQSDHRPTPRTTQHRPERTRHLRPPRLHRRTTPHPPQRSPPIPQEHRRRPHPRKPDPPRTTRTPTPPPQAHLEEHHPMTTALAGSVPAVTVNDIARVVDELTIAAADTPASTRIHIPLITMLRDEKGASLGSTSTGRGSRSRIPLSVEALVVWEQVGEIVRGLHESINGAPPRQGSVEQILAAWMRDVAAADADSRMRQYSQGVPETGLSQDTLRAHLATVTWIRDRIQQLLDPAATGDIPGAACPVCRSTTATQWRDGDWEQMPAIGFTRDREGAIDHVHCRNHECRATWTGWQGIQTLRRQVELNSVFGAAHEPNDREQGND